MSAECAETFLDPDSQESDSRDASDDMPCTGVQAAYSGRSPADVRKALKAALLRQDLSTRRILISFDFWRLLCWLRCWLRAVKFQINLGQFPPQILLFIFRLVSDEMIVGPARLRTRR